MRSPATSSPFTNSFTLGKFSSDVRFPDAKLATRKYYSFGVGRAGYKRIQAGAITRDGKLPIIPSDAQIFSYVMGSDSFAAGSPNTHTVTPGNRAILPNLSLSALMVDDAATRQFQRTFIGTVVEEANFTVSKEEELHADLGIMSRTVADEKTHAPSGGVINPAFNGNTDITGRPYMWHDSIVTLASQAAGSPGSYQGAQRVARTEALRMSVKNNHSTKRYLVDVGGQDPTEYLTGRPDFSFGMDFVPAGSLYGDTGSYTYSDGSQTTMESIYNVLDNQVYVNITVKLTKQSAPNTPTSGASENSVQFFFNDCLVTEAPHDFRIDGNETVVPVVVEPRTMTWTVKDSLPQYF